MIPALQIGFPVKDTAFQLRNASDLYTEKALTFNQPVAGTFEGRVSGVTIREVGGVPKAFYRIEVLLATLTD